MEFSILIEVGRDTRLSIEEIYLFNVYSIHYHTKIGIFVATKAILVLFPALSYLQQSRSFLDRSYS